MSVGATGTPILDGFEFPYPSARNPMKVDFVDESRYINMRDGGKRLVGDRRYRVKIKFGYDYMEADVYRSLLQILRLPNFEITPRTFASGNPVMAVSIPSYLVKCSSPLPTTNEVIVGTLYNIDVELEGCEVFTEPLIPTVCIPVQISTTTLSDGLDNESYNQTLSAIGSPSIVWSLVSGALPAGLSLSAAGVISGSANVGGNYQVFNFRVKAENPCGSDEQDLSINIVA